MLFILAVTSIGVYGVVLAGWASNSKYSVLAASRLGPDDQLRVGAGHYRAHPDRDGQFMTWGKSSRPSGRCVVHLHPAVGGAGFYIAALAELQRAPFDLLEAEELSAGFNVEYGGDALLACSSWPST